MICRPIPCPVSMGKALLMLACALMALPTMAQRDPTVAPQTAAGAQSAQAGAVPNLMAGLPAGSAAAQATQDAALPDASGAAAYDLIRDYRGQLCFLHASERYCSGSRFGEARVVAVGETQIRLRDKAGVVTTIDRDVVKPSFVIKRTPSLSATTSTHLGAQK